MKPGDVNSLGYIREIECDAELSEDLFSEVGITHTLEGVEQELRNAFEVVSDETVTSIAVAAQYTSNPSR